MPVRRSTGRWPALAVVLLTVLCARAGGQTSAPADARLLLTESDYCRSHFQFGWDRFSPKALKDQTEVDKKIVDRLERPTKAFLAERKIDWEKNDWRDWAWTNRDYQNDELPEFRRPVRFTDPPSPQWRQVEFDDGAWPRQVRPMGVGPLHGVLFTERGNLCAGLQVACHRYAFELPDPAAAGDLTLQGEYVGGVRVFLNGKEIARGHLPQGELDADAAAEPYPAEAYRWKFAELSEQDQQAIRQRYLKDKPAPEYWGYAGWNIPPGSPSGYFHLPSTSRCREKSTTPTSRSGSPFFLNTTRCGRMGTAVIVHGVLYGIP